MKYLLNLLTIWKELKKHNVMDVVRVCEPTYKIEELRKEGIEVTDLVFDDGTFPPSEIVEHWFDLLRRRWVKCFFFFFFLMYLLYKLVLNRVVLSKIWYWSIVMCGRSLCGRIRKSAGFGSLSPNWTWDEVWRCCRINPRVFTFFKNQRGRTKLIVTCFTIGSVVVPSILSN